jgi:glycosyltransferase 2 family protein
LKKFKEKAKKTGEEVEISSREFKNEKWTFWLKIFVATFLSWTSRYLVINCIIAAFISLRFSDHFYILGKQLVLWLFMLISPTPGASGVAEYAFSELMSSFSSSLFLLSALAIIWRLISYFPYLIIGAFVLPRWLKSTKN